MFFPKKCSCKRYLSALDSILVRYNYCFQIMTSFDKKEVEKAQEELKWIRLKYPDGDKQNLESKLLRNPFVPIGAAATVVALGLGIFNFYKHDSLKQQLMMRCRIAAQGFTVVAVMVGLLLEKYS